MKNPDQWPKSWIGAGGLLGLAVVVARVTRTPLAVLLVAVPQLIKLMQSFERVQAQTQQKQQQNMQKQGHMTREEAALILGVSQQATPEEVREAYRRMMLKNHPDHGGSDYLAAKINQARDILMGS